jgi:two-component system sensor histidine kinase KdpD
LNLLTISLLFLLVVVAAASRCGFWQASYASFLAVLLIDYYFEPPLFSFEVANSGIFVALVTFEVTALVISRISAKELRNAREAARYRVETEHLYELSRNSLLIDRRKPPGPQLAVLIQRIFDARGVSIFDMNLGRQDRVGDWPIDEEDIARECFLRDNSTDDPYTEMSQRVLRSGSGPLGAMVIRGKVSPMIVDALRALAEIAINQHLSFESEDRAETAKSSEQLRAAVMDALAHEFKTPLTAVRTASSGLLEAGGLKANQYELAKLIDEGAIRLNELCTRLLKAAKLSPEQVDLKVGEVNLQELISEVLAEASGNGHGNSVQVAIDSSSQMVRVDRDLLGMILRQYVDNAMKYSTRGTPIEIKAQKSHTDVLISVHNFGPTVKIEDREQIFERFYRAPELKDAVPGTGIGLSVVKKAAEAHHGHVWVISDDKEGTTFFLSLSNGTRRAQ